jgi:hypothetical protein
MTKVYDVNGTFGGPILVDRLWFFVNGTSRQHEREQQRLLQPQCRRSIEVAIRAGHERREYSDRTFENASARGPGK